jgi:hypothetical protein
METALGLETTMTALQALSNEIVTFGDLKPLTAATSPCITMVVPLPNPAVVEVRLKNAVRAVQDKLAERGIDKTSSATLIGPINDLATTAEAAGIWAHALILLRSPELFRCYLLHGRFQEMVTVEERFQVRPLLATLSREQRFHLLGLSRRHVRLLHCTHHRAEEAVIRGIIPQNMDVWLNTRMPDHVLDNRSAAGSSVGAMKGVVFGTSTDRDRDDQYLAHYFKEIDKGVNTVLRDHTAPLVLAGVEYELAIYRRVNTYRPLLEKAVKGSPDGLPSRTLHERAMEIVMQTFSEPLQKSLADFQNYRDTMRVSTDAPAVIKAAWQSRVLELFISEKAEQRGMWNEQTQDIESGDRGEDLLNAAALQTVRHGGRAFVLNASEMPVPAEVAAVLRF